jgi:hypothetical protein
LIKKVCRNWRERRVLLLVATFTFGVFSFIVVLLICKGISLFIDLRLGVFLTTLIISGVPILLLLALAKRHEDRVMFLKWLARSTYQGSSHCCLNCWHMMPSTESKECPHCGEPASYFEYNGEGAPISDAESLRHKPSLSSTAQKLPGRRMRQKLSTFILNEPPGNLLADFGGMLAFNDGPLIIAIIFTVFVGSIFIWISSLLGFWWAILAVIFSLIAPVILIIWLIWRNLTEPKRLHRLIQDDYPDGSVPWCVYCDNDLRGLAANTCPICAREVCAYAPD